MDLQKVIWFVFPYDELFCYVSEVRIRFRRVCFDDFVGVQLEKIGDLRSCCSGECSSTLDVFGYRKLNTISGYEFGIIICANSTEHTCYSQETRIPRSFSAMSENDASDGYIN